jgi:hypothetical protein
VLHFFYTKSYEPDRTPQYLPHDLFIPSTVGGLEGHTGSPTQVAAIEDTGLTPHGTVVFAEASTGPSQSHKILMEEFGHALGAGYADDQALRVGERYSGGRCYGPGPGTDQTPEYATAERNGEWSVMSLDPDRFGTYRTAFSIEELSTSDFEDIPSVDD